MLRLCLRVATFGLVFAAGYAPLKATSETVVHSFGGSGDGVRPESGLAADASGNLYGVTPNGGDWGGGTAFQIATDGTYTLIHSFCQPPDCLDGVFPNGPLTLGQDGNFYGTTTLGGPDNVGTIFKMSTAGTVTNLYNFTSGFIQPTSPTGALALGPDGNFYGMTRGGLFGTGTIFKVTPDGVVTNIFTFGNRRLNRTGASPYGGLVLGPDGNFYGATVYGGSADDGVAFRITPSGKFTALHSFTTADGINPFAPMTVGPDGALYGTTESGGTFSYGTVYRLTTSGAFSVIHALSYLEGIFPEGALLLDGSALYGTTSAGGTNGSGTIFSITPAGITNLVYAFGGVGSGDGYDTTAGLIKGIDGDYYGVTQFGGTGSGYGTAFKVVP